MAGLRWKPIDPKAKTPASSSTSPNAQRQSAGGGQGGGQGVRQFGSGPGGGQRGGRGIPVDQLATTLDLTAAQKAQVQTIADKTRAEVMATMQSAGGDRTAMRGAMRAANDKAYGDIAKILTKDQQPKLAAFRESAAARNGGPRIAPERTVYILKDNKPTEAKVRVGADDGSWSEIIGGTLKEGDLVIIGGGPQPKGQTAAQSGQRVGGGVLPGIGGPAGGFGGGGGRPR
jgi:HlyD family secretion protein